MSVDYKQLKILVKEAMFTGGGINEPSAPEGIPHRMPASDTRDKEQDQGDPKANELYSMAVDARAAVEDLVVALDDPFYDGAYEYAFKASASLRRALLDLEESGAHPMPDERVVAPRKNQQRFGSFASQQGAATYGDSAGLLGLGALEEVEGVAPVAAAGDDEETKLGTLGAQGISKSTHAKTSKDHGSAIGKGDTLGDIDNKERAMLVDIEKIFTKVADEADLTAFRPILQSFLKQILKKAAK